MEKIYIGVDPGNNGAFSVVNQHGALIQVFDMPTVQVKVGAKNKTRIVPQLMVSELHLFKNFDVFALIENVNASPGMGVVSAFNFGKGAGLVEGVFAGMVMPYGHVTPALWKKYFKLSQNKDESRELAMQLWPSHAHEFKLKKHDGRAESALIALYQLKKETKK
jgi:crossover junction endodeoxyribonuclease RuvC